MDAALKAKWVEALRSGEFKQAEGVLYDTKSNSYCCLGVLCRVAGAEWGDAQKEVEGHEGPYMETLHHVPIKDGEILGNSDEEKLEMSACLKFGIPEQHALIRLNDGVGKEGQDGYQPPKSFPEIADYIEKNL